MKCENCGGEGATLGLSPFALEIHNEEIEVCYCDSCYEQDADDI